jgi:hypothetical protein
MTRPALAILALLVALAATAPAAAAAPADLSDDGTGKRWRQLKETTGLTPDRVAQVCHRDGETRCSGSIGARDLSGWIWATGAQVRDLLALYEPALLTASPSTVAGPEYLGSAMGFLQDMTPTLEVDGYGFHTSFAGGWTSSTEEDGRPTFGSAGFGWYPISGSLSVGPIANPDPIQFYGVWLWRPSSDDLTPPTITPTVSGTLGKNGWYVSNVSVSWDVLDAESEVASRSGCDAATVSSDTTGTTFTCEATSAGGTASRSVVVKRDATPPTVTCSTPPQVFELSQVGAVVRAGVTDATSGPGTPLPQAAASTGAPGTFAAVLNGFDQAGNRTTRACTYQVVVPTCNGLTPTIVGSALNNIINGTSGRDVIQALGGSDTINGLGGDDVICGHDGLDKIYGGDGDDWIDGGASNDDLNGGDGDDFIDGGLHNDSIRGDGGRDTCRSGELRMSSCEA